MQELSFMIFFIIPAIIYDNRILQLEQTEFKMSLLIFSILIPKSIRKKKGGLLHFFYARFRDKFFMISIKINLSYHNNVGNILLYNLFYQEKVHKCCKTPKKITALVSSSLKKGTSVTFYFIFAHLIILISHLSTDL